MTPEQKSKILTLLHNSEYGVVSTRSITGAPQSAVVAISETPDCCIVIGSFEDTRKNQNIRKDPLVSVVVGWDKEKLQTLQIEGRAEIVLGRERKHLEEAHCKKNPNSGKYCSDQRQQYIKIKPFWIRYSDLSADPEEVWEISI